MKKGIVTLFILMLFSSISFSQPTIGSAKGYVRDLGYFIVDSAGVYFPFKDTARSFPSIAPGTLLFFNKADSTPYARINSKNRKLVILDSNKHIPYAQLPEISDTVQLVSGVATISNSSITSKSVPQVSLRRHKDPAVTIAVSTTHLIAVTGPGVLTITATRFTGITNTADTSIVNYTVHFNNGK